MSQPDGAWELLTRRQLAERLQCSLRSVDKMMQRHQIPYLRLSGRMIRFNWTEVCRALERYRIDEVGRHDGCRYAQRSGRR